jgi:hypothetical protein
MHQHGVGQLQKINQQEKLPLPSEDNHHRGNIEKNSNHRGEENQKENTCTPSCH